MEFDFGFIFFVAFLVLVVTIPVLILWGLPVHLVLKHYNLDSFVWYVISGILAGISILVLLHQVLEFNDALLFGLQGIIGSGVFWWHEVYKKHI